MFDPNEPMPDFATQQEQIDRQRAMADILRGQNTAQPTMNTSGRIHVKPHWSEYLAPLLNKLSSARADRNVLEASDRLGVQQSAAANDWRGNMPTATPAVAENAPIDGMGPTLPAQEAKPVSRDAILKYTLAGMKNPRTVKEAGLVNQSLTQDLTRSEDQAFKDDQARTAAVERLDQRKEVMQSHMRELTSRIEDKALDRESKEAYQTRLTDMQDQWKKADIESRKYAVDENNATRRSTASQHNETMRAIAASRGGKGAEDKPQKPLSSVMSKAWFENTNSIAKLDRADEELNKYEAGVGPKRALPEWMNSRVDPAGVTVRAVVGDIGSMKIHDRSGAAVTKAESPRLMSFTPRIHDDPGVIRDKLNNFRAEYRQAQQGILDYAESQNQMSPLKAGASIGPPPTPSGINSSPAASNERIIGGKRYINKGGGKDDWHSVQ